MKVAFRGYLIFAKPMMNPNGVFPNGYWIFGKVVLMLYLRVVRFILQHPQSHITATDELGIQNSSSTGHIDAPRTPSFKQET